MPAMLLITFSKLLISVFVASAAIIKLSAYKISEPKKIENPRELYFSAIWGKHLFNENR